MIQLLNPDNNQLIYKNHLNEKKTIDLMSL